METKVSALPGPQRSFVPPNRTISTSSAVDYKRLALHMDGSPTGRVRPTPADDSPRGGQAGNEYQEPVLWRRRLVIGIIGLLPLVTASVVSVYASEQIRQSVLEEATSAAAAVWRDDLNAALELRVAAPIEAADRDLRVLRHILQWQSPELANRSLGRE